MQMKISKIKTGTSLPALLISATIIPGISFAADLHQAEPGELVIMRKVTPQPHNRVDQQGPIMNKIDLRHDATVNHRILGGMDQHLDHIHAIALSDDEAAGVRGMPNPGDEVQRILGTGNTASHQSARGLDGGRSLSRSTSDSGHLFQAIGTASGGGGDVGDAMQGLNNTLGSMLDSMNR